MSAAWRVVLIFDGGSRGNPGPAYGSYQVYIQQAGSGPGRRGRPAVRTLNLGWGTSNEAEYQTLIAGLRDVLEQLEQAEADPGEAWLEVRGDSQLVLSQIGGSWKAKDARMRRLRDEARSLLGRFGKTKLTRQPREQTVATLGH